MYKIGKKYGNLNRKIYIDWNFKDLLASNFTESLFFKRSNPYKILQDLSGRFSLKYRKKIVLFL